MAKSYQEITVLNAKNSTGVDNATGFLVENYDFILISFASAGSANGTVKFQGSIQDTAPTWTSAQSATNHWDYIDVIDCEDGASIDGDTGIALAGSDDVRLLQVNCDGLKWFNAIVTARSAGTFTVKIKGFSRSANA